MENEILSSSAATPPAPAFEAPAVSQHAVTQPDASESAANEAAESKSIAPSAGEAGPPAESLPGSRKTTQSLAPTATGPKPGSTTNPEARPASGPEPALEAGPSFGEMLAEFEQGHRRLEGSPQLEGTVLAVTADAVILDIGFKSEGVLPRGVFPNNAEEVKAGEKVSVSVKGRNAEGYYELSRFKVAQPTDWTSLEQAFAQKSAIVGTVTAVVKGGLSVDVGVRAFMPASRGGERDAAGMEKLVGQEITCRIIKLNVADEDVVVDRRAILEEQALSQEQNRCAALRVGDVVSGKVRSLMNYGAFVDLGGLDGLLHVSDLAWSRVRQPEDVLTVGQTLDVKVLKIDPESRRISLGLKQLQPEPWETAADRYKPGQRVTATVVRLMDFGAFVELEPGIEGLIHVSEMSWVKKVRRPSDLLKEGDTVEAVVLSVHVPERRIGLGLKQALGDPWTEVPQRFPASSAIEGPVTRLTKFGAFVQMTEGVEGLVHISEITAERHLHHPQDVLKVGQMVRAQVLAIDTEKRQVKLSMKQLVPTSLDEYLAEHQDGDVVSGRVVEASDSGMTVELGEGIRAACRPAERLAAKASAKSESRADLSSLTSMLQARWKGGGATIAVEPGLLRVGQVGSFRIVKLDRERKAIELQPA